MPREPITNKDELSQAILFELLKKLTLRPCAEGGLAWELVSRETSDESAIPVARGFGDTPMDALSDMAINIAKNDPFGERDTFREPDAEAGKADGSDTD